jgi:phosphoribosylformylglycinamidine (FGAM) synthase-like enzyme
VGCVGLVADVTRIPNRWRRGDRVLLLRGEGAELIRFVWQNAHRCSLTHDVSDGGVAVALAEAEAWSELEAQVEVVEGAGVVVATTEALGWPDTVELGTVSH